MFNTRFFKWFGFIALLLGSAPSAWGQSCEQPAINANNGLPYYTAIVSGVNPPTFDPNAYAVGARIGNKMTGTVLITNTTGNPSVKCGNTGGIFNPMGQGFGTPVNNVYPTSVPGVGLRISTSLGVWPARVTGGVSMSGSTWLQTFQISLELIKTGPITQAGVLMGDFGAYRFDLDGQILVLFGWANPVPVTPVVPACTVVTPNIKVPLGAVSARVFQGPGTTSPATDFSIDLACSGGSLGTHVNAYVTLTDSTNAGNITTTLPLSSAAGSTAQGVGVQVLNHGTPVAFGPDSKTIGNTNQWQAGSINQGVSTFSIPLQAQYIQSGERVTAGIANAVATFTMAYQ